MIVKKYRYGRTGGRRRGRKEGNGGLKTCKTSIKRRGKIKVNKEEEEAKEKKNGGKEKEIKRK